MGRIGLLLASAVMAMQGAAPPSEERRHAIGPLTRYARGGEAVRSLLPLQVETKEDGSGSIAGEGFTFLRPEDVVTLLRTTVAPEATFRLADSRSIVVEAPGEVHDRIADLLARMAELVPNEQLEVRVLDDRVTPPRLAEGATVGLREGALVSIAIGASTTFVIGGSADDGHDPQPGPRLGRLHGGLECAATSTRVGGGAVVRLFIRSSELTAPTTARTFGRAATPAIDQPHVAFASFAGSLFLAAGEPVQLPVTIATASGPVRLTFELRLRIDSGSGAMRYGPVVGSDGRERWLEIRRGMTPAITGIGIGRLTADAFEAARSYESIVHFPTDVQGCIPIEPADRRMLVEALEAERDEDPLATFNLTSNDVLIVLADEPALARLRPKLDRFQQRDGDWRIRGRLLDGPDELASFELPMLLGEACALWAGVESTRIDGWERRSTGDGAAGSPLRPRVLPVMDGMALRLELTEGVAVNRVLAVVGKVHLLEAPLEAVRGRDPLEVDRFTARTLFFDESCMLPATGGKASFGGAIRLELELFRPSH